MSVANVFCFVVAIISALEISRIKCSEFRVIDTSDGAVRGVKNTTWWKNVDYYSFKGIPYAEKPIGRLRFKAPKPIEPWKPTILDAFQFGNICIQLISQKSFPESEDCLFLNIYVPADLKSHEKVPVLIFIHGGEHAYGNGNDDWFGPDFVLEKRVILVTFNYRLGIFGFLSLNSPEYSGNMGLKDQQLALKWIHKNIEHFNGDNNKITIFGYSSGSALTHFQLLSTESRKYFQYAIAISGTAFNYWPMSENNDHLEMAYKMARNFSKPVAQLDELVEVLLSETPENMVRFLRPKLNRNRTMTILLTPVIESEKNQTNAKKSNKLLLSMKIGADAIQPFITESIEKVYDTHDINVTTMFTVSTAEILYMTKKFPNIADIDGLNTNFSLKLPFRGLSLAPDSEEYRTLNEEIRQFYFGNDIINENKFTEYVALLSDLNFCYGIDKAAKLHASKSKGKTFYAQFAVDSKLNIFKILYSKFQIAGASHCDDINYLFRRKKFQRFYDDVFNTPDDEQSIICIQTIERLTNLFTKFSEIDHSGHSATAGIEFKPIQNGEINFLNITNDGLQPGRNPNSRAMEFWSNIEKKIQNYIGVN